MQIRLIGERGPVGEQTEQEEGEGRTVDILTSVRKRKGRDVVY